MYLIVTDVCTKHASLCIVEVGGYCNVLCIRILCYEYVLEIFVQNKLENRESVKFMKMIGDGIAILPTILIQACCIK